MGALVRSWPTPTTAPDAKNLGSNQMSGPPSLGEAAKQWPTPVARDWKGRTSQKCREGGPSLPNVASEWPTPMVSDVARGSGTYMRGNPTLKGAAKGWATPCVMDSAGHAYTRDKGEKGAERPALLGQACSLGLPGPTTPTDGASTSTAGRVLNPRFVEALMGWPAGWTDCASWETESSPTKQPSPSESCGPAFTEERSA